jgi:hypothetical protein
VSEADTAGELLAGGFVSAPRRVGDTVMRQPGSSSEFVRRLLRFLEQAGFGGAPRFLGEDAEGREVLTFVAGYVPWQRGEAAQVRSASSLAAAGALLRQFHDLTAGTALAGDSEVVCHNDLSPRNTIYRDLGAGLVPVAFIDWDIAAPGARIHDVAHMCWQYPGLGPAAEPAAAARQVALICDAYRLADRTALVDTILWWQDRCWRGIEAGAAAGSAAMLRIAATGAPEAIRQESRWVEQHKAALQAAVG